MKHVLILVTAVTAALVLQFGSPQVAFGSENCSSFVHTYTSGVNTVLENGHPAVLAYAQSLLWAAPFADSRWIWSTYLVADPEHEDTEIFIVPVTLSGNATDSTLLIAADDYYRISINGIEIASEFGEGNFLQSVVHAYHPTALLKKGNNTIVIAVTNAAYFYQGQGTPYNNPAGLLYRLDVSGSECATVSADASSSVVENGPPSRTQLFSGGAPSVAAMPSKPEIPEGADQEASGTPEVAVTNRSDNALVSTLASASTFAARTIAANVEGVFNTKTFSGSNTPICAARSIEVFLMAVILALLAIHAFFGVGPRRVHGLLQVIGLSIVIIAVIGLSFLSLRCALPHALALGGIAGALVAYAALHAYVQKVF